MEWLPINWLPLTIVVIAVLIFIGIIIYLCKKRGIRQVALEAILIAEQQYESTTGQERLAMAIDHVYNNIIPKVITMFIPKELILSQIEKFIQKLFDDVKALLDYNRQEIEKEVTK